jgi:hypothetical protein
MMLKCLRLALIGLAMFVVASGLQAKSDAVNNGYYTTSDKEFYLDADEIFFIRPGLELEILDVTIPADMQPEVTFKLSDPGGLPLDRNGVFTPGPVSTSFIIAYIPEPGAAYVSYTTRVQTSPITGDSATQASTDSGGSYTDMGNGTYMYKFGTMLPAGYDADVTHTVGIYARRDLREFELDRYVTNELEHFVPSGATMPVPRDIVTTDTCNRCHDPLAIHGGSRQEVGLCVLCHNATQDIDPDTGSSIYMPNMVHKIHNGANLANGYTVIGYRQGVHDYSDVHLPEGSEPNNCQICHTGGIPTENFPVVASPNPVPVCDGTGRGTTTISWDRPEGVEIRMGSETGTLFANARGQGSKDTGVWVRNGLKFVVIDPASGDVIQNLYVKTTAMGCSGNAPYAERGTPGAQHTNWLDNPSRVACGACHDHVNFATGEGHSSSGLAQADDTRCGNCHRPDSGNEYDRSITGAHTVIFNSSQLPGVILEFIDIRDTNPGDRPTVTFSLTTRDFPMDPDDVDRIRFVIVGPNEDFSFRLQETVGDKARNAGPYWEYTFESPLPLDAEGSYTISVEGREDRVVNMGDESEEEHDTIQATLMAFAVTDATPMPRREVVSDENCESCHTNLAAHGGGRTNVDYCSTCHLPDAVAQLEPQESYAMKFMIHKIHRGADLEKGYVVVRSRGVYDFSDVHYVGDLRNCEACHINDSYQLPLPDGLIATPTPKNWWPVMEPAAAACLSCHDGDDAAAHVYSNTAFFGESCSSCHGEGASFSVDKVHAR